MDEKTMTLLEELREELKHTVSELAEVEADVRNVAFTHDIEPAKMRLPDGQWALAPILTAKTQALVALVDLEILIK